MFLGGAHYTEFVDQFLQIFTKTLGDWRSRLKTAQYLYAIGLEKIQAFLRFRAYTPRRLRVRCKVLLESARFMTKSYLSFGTCQASRLRRFGSVTTGFCALRIDEGLLSRVDGRGPVSQRH